MEFTLTFFKIFTHGISLSYPLLLSFIILIVFVGQIVGRKESWTIFDSFYWSFITATTVGYGDIRPMHKLSKSLSVLIALLGIILTGILVALAVHSATAAFNEYSDLSKIKTNVEQIKQPLRQ